MQLDIFSIAPCSGREVREFADLPKAIIPLQPKEEIAIGCTVKSSKFYRGKTGKLVEFKETAGTRFAMVLFPHGLPLYPCRLSDLEVLE